MKLLLTTIKNECIHSKLALKYLYNVVEDAPIETDIVEFNEKTHLDVVYESIVAKKYSILYFHCNMLNESAITKLCERIKKALPTSIVVVGGKHVSFNTKEFMTEHPEIDYVIRGEGESVFFNFIKSILTYDFDFENIAGLAYWDNDVINVNPLDAPIRMEELPFPYENEELYSDQTIYYESFRGDVDRCVYARFLPDRKVRSLSLNRVCTELRYFIVKNVKTVVFTDKWFNYNTERAYRIWEYIKNNDNGSTTFVFDINGDLLNEESIRLIGDARKGLFEFNIDIESTNAETLSASGRKENIYQLMYNVSKLIQQGNVKVNVTIRAGLPCDTPEMFARTFNKVYGLAADTMSIEILSIRPGTLLSEEADRFGYVYDSFPPYKVIANDYMPATELIRINRISEISEMYISGKNFERSLPRIMTDIGIKPFTFFDGFTSYVYRNNLKDQMVIRENLYRILYNFATGLYDSKNETLKLQILREVIHADLEENVSEEEVIRFDKRGWEMTYA